MSGEQREASDVTLKLCAAVAASALLITITGAGSALAQKPGGVLHVAHRDSPASMSTLEEVTISTVAPMMAIFNNLVDRT
jgi:hypothetical protein